MRGESYGECTDRFHTLYCNFRRHFVRVRFYRNAACQTQKMTKEGMQRTILSVVVFAIIYWSSDFVIGWREFNVYVKAIEFLAAVIGAGCYWIGSKK